MTIEILSHKEQSFQEELVLKKINNCGATVNLIYLETKTGKGYCVNLGDAKALHYKKNGE